MEATLHDRLYKNTDTLSDDYKMIYMYQILSGLNYLHSCNIIHRVLEITYNFDKKQSFYNYFLFDSRI